MPITLDGTNGITTPMYNGSITANAVTPSVNMKNRIINGAMVIDQRNAGASVTATTGTVYSVDRFYVQGSITSKFTVQQSSTAPAGFINSLLLTSSAATTPSASDYYYFAQSIEGLNVADLDWGTANAKTITISFWVRSSLTGTFSGAVLNSATDRSYAFTFTINSANTFEYKTVTIVGDTSGTWLKTNGIGILVRFALGAGSSFLQTAGSWGTGNVVGATGTTQLISTNGATLYLTGVQLEVGSTATSFDYRPYGTELQLCQRYCYAIKASEASGAYSTFMQQGAYTTTALTGNFIPKVTMRVVPTLSTTGTASNYLVFNGTFYTLNSVPAITTDSTPSSFTVDASVSSGLTAGYVYRMTANNNNVAYLIFSAEL